MDSLESIYNPENFRTLGHQLIDVLADHLHIINNNQGKKVLTFKNPENNYLDWQQQSFDNPISLFKEILQNSIHLHNPKYMGHQVTVPAPLAALAGMQGMLLNSGGAIYEMSAASSTLEKLVIDSLKSYFGFPDGDGIITSGGTLANLTALICARNCKANESIWKEGSTHKYAFMVSSEAHYCIDRAVRVMGMGDSGIILIPVDDNYTMRTDLLPEYYKSAIDQGIQVLGVIGSAPSTSTGMYDDLQAIGEFCNNNNLWFHIDAAHGGPAAFSEKYKHLLNGAHLADSITVDAHKMMMVPSLTTLLFFKESKDSYKTFAQKAQYLWDGADDEWYNYGKRTMECTKIMLSTRIYAMISMYGISIFGEYVDKCYDLAVTFSKLLAANPLFELAVLPHSNIVCFRMLAIYPDENNKLNIFLRKQILEDGHFYIVQTTLHSSIYLRVSIMNPFTTTEHFIELIQLLEKHFNSYHKAHS